MQAACMCGPATQHEPHVVSSVGPMADRGSFQHARLVHAVAQSQQHGGPVAGSAPLISFCSSENIERAPPDGLLKLPRQGPSRQCYSRHREPDLPADLRCGVGLFVNTSAENGVCAGMTVPPVEEEEDVSNCGNSSSNPASRPVDFGVVGWAPNVFAILHTARKLPR